MIIIIIIIRLKYECIRNASWKYSMEQKNSLHRFSPISRWGDITKFEHNNVDL